MPTFDGTVVQDGGAPAARVPASPDPPALADDVEVLGEAQGTGFADRQWLVRRGERLFQLPELCHAVIQEIDGRRTVEDIAARVTEKTEWLVTTEHVRQILRTKLLPLGLLDVSAEAPARGVEARRRSPLQVGARRRLAGPRVLEPVTRLLQHLYAPGVLVALLVVSAVAYGWFYLVHGIGEPVRAALYTPGGLLVTLALTILAAAFHELGHAAALRYGGGTVRSIGMGLYLVYPTFYTDVTDAYRLSRWARVRTDLGGIYFHLLFGLALIGLYCLSGHEVLLAVVLVITADALYQCVPFVRLDGYWAVGDLIGIPDLFSHLAPFLRSLVPASRRPPGTVSRLRPCVKVAFAVYVALTLPVLAAAGVLLFRGVPRFFTTSMDSLLYQTRVFTAAMAAVDLVLVTAVVAQAALLTLSMLATVYVMATLSRPPLRALWRWSRPTPLRRSIGALVGAAAGGLVVATWAPDMPFGTVGPQDVQSFEIADRLHVETAVSYAQTPPVGGPHAPLWQNCGFYDAPIPSERAVHSLEHGAVWVTYRPELATQQIDTLAALARSQPYVLVSPFPGVPSPVVASAWSRQLQLESADDPRLLEFVRAFRLGAQAPERGGPCSGGAGRPVRR